MRIEVALVIRSRSCIEIFNEIHEAIDFMVRHEVEVALVDGRLLSLEGLKEMIK